MYHDIHEEINEKIQSRQFPDTPLEPNFDFRSVKTRYSLFPVVDMRMPTTEKVNDYLDYHLEINFTPSTRKAPCNGFFTNIDTESSLRNQGKLLQRDYYHSNEQTENGGSSYSAFIDDISILGASMYSAGQVRQPPTTRNENGNNLENSFYFSTRNQIRQ